jgi:hypothetical protein
VVVQLSARRSKVDSIHQRRHHYSLSESVVSSEAHVETAWKPLVETLEDLRYPVVPGHDGLVQQQRPQQVLTAQRPSFGLLLQ